MKSRTLGPALVLFVNASRCLASASIFDESQGDSPGLRGRSRPHAAQTRIIGGVEARANAHNFAVSLQDSLGHFCGGSLIARDVVLSAAHCRGGSYDVVLGRHDLDSGGGQRIPMARELPHPKYKERGTDNDFLLVFLTRPATLNRDVDTIALNDDASVPAAGAGVTVMGWGDTDIRDSVDVLSDVLREVQVSVVDNDECEDSSGTVDGRRDDYHGKITKNMLCATSGDRRDSCQGDSGGPLVAGPRQVGVVSWGISCASGVFPGVYARVSRAHEWIEEEVCAGSAHAAAAGFRCPGAGAASRPSAYSGDADPGPSPSGGRSNDELAAATGPSSTGDDSPPAPSSGGGGSRDDECASMNKWACKDEPGCKWKKGTCKSRGGSTPSDGGGPTSCADVDMRECKDRPDCHWKKGWSICLDKN